MSILVLFDLPARDGRCWSPNPWKTRLALNFKGLEYETQWLEYPEIADLFSSFGLPPNETGPAAYTIPAMRISGDKYVMDSRKIAEALETEFPSPSLHLDSPVLLKVEELYTKAFPAVAPDLLPDVPQTFLNPVSASYFEETRSKRFGMPLAELQKTKGGESAWDAARPYLKEMAALLKESGGPYFLGNKFSYADCYLVALIHFAQRQGKYDIAVSVDPALARLYEASSQYLERDEH